MQRAADKPLERGSKSPAGLPTAAEAIIKQLVSMGVDTFFGIPGGPVIHFFDAILSHPGATLVESRHETTAAFEAMGFFRATGRTPALVVTAGPGATNCVTGVIAASLEDVPMVVLCGDVAWASTGRKLLQDLGPTGGLNAERMFASARLVERLAHGASAVPQVTAVVEAARNARRPGPAMLVTAIDYASQRREPVQIVLGKSMPPPRAAPREGWLCTLAARIRTAERPWIVLGNGARRAAPSVRRLVDLLGIPVVTTPQAKGLLDEEHPLSLRTMGMGASWWARRYAKARPDFALVLGTDLDDVSCAGTAPIGERGSLVHVDRDPSVFGRNFPTCEGVVSNIEAFVEGLIGVLDEPLAPHRVCSDATIFRAGSPYDAPEWRSDDASPMPAHRVIAALEASAPEGTTFVSDIGEHMLFALHYLTARAPDRFAIHLGLGSMGSGIGSAIGHALGRRDRLVVCVCGDGGMQMVGGEILVAIEHKLPVVFAVMNDGRYNMVHHGYRELCGGDHAFDTQWVDFAMWANAMKVRSLSVTDAAEITPELLREVLDGRGPLVLDIHHDPDVRVKGEGRIEALRQMSLASFDEEEK